MIKKLAIYFAIASMALGIYSCNTETASVEYTATSAAVRTFSLAKNDTVLANLDSVFFSIDLVKGRIFNANSLPKGTDVTGLVPVLTTLNGCSVAEFTVSRTGKSDTIYNFLTTPEAKIDFTNPVKLRIVSPDGLIERTYTVNVNVYKTDADSLEWARVDRRTLPSTFAYPERQHTVRYGNKLVCFTYYQGAYCVSTLGADLDNIQGTSPDLGLWDNQRVTFPAEIDIDSFTAGDDALYILGTDGTLYRSADGLAWSSTGQAWHAIYGSYGANLYGSRRNANGSWVIESYPSLTTTALPDGMPVSGTSAPVTYSFSMSANPQMLLVGGRDANGRLTADTWGFDGTTWARVSQRPLPVSLEYAAVAPYVSLTVNSNWNITERPTLVLIGGRKSDNTMNSVVYISNDYGFTWSKAGANLQLPDYIPAMYKSQAFVISATLRADIVRPMISKPVESWDCPYIYIFGGVNAEGRTSNNVWRGVINRLSFKPIV